MRVIETKVYTFDELSEEGKQNAIEGIRKSYYEYNDFGSWAVDDCGLFEPNHKELVDLLGSDYDFPLIKNTRKNIYFDTDRNSYLDCSEAIEITNNDHFLKWLGLTDEIINGEDFSFNIYTSGYRNSDTTIEFDGFSSDFDSTIQDAIDKFDNHIGEILKYIENNIDYRFTDEAIIEDIEANEYEFTEDGKLI